VGQALSPANLAAQECEKLAGESACPLRIHESRHRSCTTNSALAWIDEREAEDRDFPPVHVFETPAIDRRWPD